MLEPARYFFSAAHVAHVSGGAADILLAAVGSAARLVSVLPDSEFVTEYNGRAERDWTQGSKRPMGESPEG